MKRRGIYLAFEAMLSLLILFAILSIPMQNKMEDLDELHILQKEDDLLKAWLFERDFDLDGMKADFEFVFPNSSGEIGLGNERIAVGKPGGRHRETYSASGFALDGELNAVEISISIYG
ncbi:MAG: hypothetical protein HYW05_02180 [Candidatus Diapherotrites archaeon]|nr:hypothetical protein [Candidatus Diapherotrites archaeon]